MLHQMWPCSSSFYRFIRLMELNETDQFSGFNDAQICGAADRLLVNHHRNLTFVYSLAVSADIELILSRF